MLYDQLLTLIHGAQISDNGGKRPCSKQGTHSDFYFVHEVRIRQGTVLLTKGQYSFTLHQKPNI